ncbi:MAG: hypothetical protein GTO62_15630, partial [Planctomycetales bacterium]|nr:hypothetical protein [Planctomycetales bacterium]
PRLVVVGGELSADHRVELVRFLNGGGTVLVVTKSAQVADSLNGLLSATRWIDQPQRRDEDAYQLVAEIDFTHPL